jgi:DNA-binding transcriptional LysR family regulator
VELRQLEYFVAVAEHLHFGRAAAALSIGQPAVSQQVARLERELGVTLFDRSARTVRLTETGRKLLPEARATLAAAEHLKAMAVAPSARPAPQTLRLGSSTGLGDRLNRVLQALAEQHPPATAELSSGPTRARLERVAAGQLDAAFVRGVTAAPGVELIGVWQDRLLAALPASHELACQQTVALADLAKMPLRLVPRQRNPPLVDLVLDACGQAGFAPVLGSPLDALETVLAAIAAGPPSWTMLYEPHARSLHQPRVAFRPTEPALVMPTALAVRQGAGSKLLAPLLQACARAGLADQDP